MLFYEYLETIKKNLIKKEKLQIFINKIDKCIKKYYDKSLQKHSKVIKIL